MQALTKVAQSLERSNPEWDIIVEDVQAQCDAAEARGMVSTARACSLEQTLAANTRFLQDISHQMEEARSEGSAAAPEYFLVTGLSQLRTSLHTSEKARQNGRNVNPFGAMASVAGDQSGPWTGWIGPAPV